MKTARDYSPEELVALRADIAAELEALPAAPLVEMHRVMRAARAMDESRVRYNTPEKEKRWACCRCGKRENPDNSAVTWQCESCNGKVCHDCTLRNPRDPRVYYDITLCSEQCLAVLRAEGHIVEGRSIDEDLG